MDVKIIEKVRVFYAYSRKDKALRDDLAKHLGRSYIDGWHDREIMPGEIWKERIDEELNSAHIVLLLISVDFIHSEYCSNIEMERALARHDAAEAHVIPIILRPTNWQDEPFSRLQVLPADGKPITIWINQDEAFLDVVKGVRKVITTFLKKQYITAAKAYANQGSYEEALIAYEWAIRLTRSTNNQDNGAALYKEKGDILLRLKRFGEALKAYDVALQLAPGQADLYKKRGDILLKLEKFTEALAAYDAALLLVPGQAELHKKRGDILLKMRRSNEALASYDEAIRLDMRNATFHVDKGNILFRMKRYDQALRAYDDAIYYDPDNAQFWRNKGQVLLSLQRHEKALAAYEEAIRLEPDNPYLYKEKGDIYFKLERLQEALAAFEDAVRLEPDFGLAYSCMGEVLEKLAENAYQTLKQRADLAHNKARNLGIKR